MVTLSQRIPERWARPLGDPLSGDHQNRAVLAPFRRPASYGLNLGRSDVPARREYNPAVAQVDSEYVFQLAWSYIVTEGMMPEAAAYKALKRIEAIFAKFPSDLPTCLGVILRFSNPPTTN
jgi:hypothetical protein